MPHYNFNQDLPIAKKSEEEVASILQKNHDAVIVSYENTNKFDIQAKIKGKFYTFEVKEDFTCERTGNVGVEFECRGKLSGISVSQADFYVYKIHSAKHGIIFRYMRTATLKKMIADNKYFRIVCRKAHFKCCFQHRLHKIKKCSRWGSSLARRITSSGVDARVTPRF
jgi:hypothetical protein